MKQILLIVLIFLNNKIHAQAEFEMPIYFEDAMGNRDTVIIGIDATASYSTITPSLGEVEDLSQFDSVLDVRLAHSDNTNLKYSKKIISNYEYYVNSHCKIAGGIRIVPYVKYPPLKMIYDHQLLLSQFCWARGLLLFNNNEYAFLHPIELHSISDSTYYCLGNTDTIVLDHDKPRTINDLTTYLSPIVTQTGFDTVQSYQLFFGDEYFLPGYMLCNFSIIGINETNTNLYPVTFYPNPASTILTLQGLDAAATTYQIFGVDNRLLIQNTVINNQIPISDLSANGIYYCKLTNAKQSQSFTFIKN